MFFRISNGYGLIVFVISGLFQKAYSQSHYVVLDGISQPVRLVDIRRSPRVQNLPYDVYSGNVPKAHSIQESRREKLILENPRTPVYSMRNPFDLMNLLSIPNSADNSARSAPMPSHLPTIPNLFSMLQMPMLPTEPKMTNSIRNKPSPRLAKKLPNDDGAPRAKSLSLKERSYVNHEIQRAPSILEYPATDLTPPVTLAPFTLHTLPTLPTISFLPTLPTISLPTISMPTFPPFTLPPSFEQLAAGYTKKSKRRKKKIKRRKPKKKHHSSEEDESSGRRKHGKSSKSKIESNEKVSHQKPKYGNVRDADLLESSSFKDPSQPSQTEDQHNRNEASWLVPYERS